MLIICGLMSLSLFIVYPSEWSLMYVGIVLILVSFFNAFLEFYQKYKSEELLKGFMVQRERWVFFMFVVIGTGQGVCY